MWRLLRLLLILLIILAILFVAFAYLGPIFMPSDFEPPARDISAPVVLGQ